MGKVIYKCKKCGWTTTLSELWQDIKPKFCPIRKCGANFRINPEHLDIIIEKDIIVSNSPIIKKSKKKK